MSGISSSLIRVLTLNWGILYEVSRVDKTLHLPHFSFLMLFYCQEQTVYFHLLQIRINIVGSLWENVLFFTLCEPVMVSQIMFRLGILKYDLQ